MLSSSAINSTKNQYKFPVKPVYYTLLLLGIVLRLIPYYLNRSLFWDEVSIALNITDRNFAGLLQPLDYQQAAPVFFLFIEKVNIILFGNSEFSLRLFPLICGLLSLPLIYRLTREISGISVTALLALFLFATSPVLIDYSNQTKQYESDVFCALCLLNLVFNPAFLANENKRYILLAVVGTVLIFMSNVAILVLFTIGVYYLLKYRVSIFRKWLLLIAFACWTISFLVYYRFFIYHNPLRDWMLWWWEGNFMPFQIFSTGFWVWMYEKFLSVFKFYSFPFSAVFLLSIPIFIVKKQRLFLFLLLFPLAVHFILSGFKQYPFEVRLILYLIAFITPALSIGIVELVQLLRKRITIYGVAILLMLLVYSIIAQLVNTHYPFWKEEITRSIDFINSNKSAGQKIYVYSGAETAAGYYARVNRIPFKQDLVWGTLNLNGDKNENCFDEINKLKGEVWVLFSSVQPIDETYIINRINRDHIPILKTFKTIGSSAYLVKINAK